MSNKKIVIVICKDLTDDEENIIAVSSTIVKAEKQVEDWFGLTAQTTSVQHVKVDRLIKTEMWSTDDSTYQVDYYWYGIDEAVTTSHFGCG